MRSATEETDTLLPDHVPIDLENQHGRALTASVERKFGPAITRFAHSLGSLFLLRSPWAPELRIVGGLIYSRSSHVHEVEHPAISLTGSGSTIEEAFVSCIGEGIERLSQFERDGDVVRVATLDQVAADLAPGLETLLGELAASDRFDPTANLAWVQGQDLKSGGPVLVPADWCLRRSSDARELPQRTAPSVGAAAGQTFEDAAVRALLEIVERHAAYVWWEAGRRPKLLPWDHGAVRAGSELIERLREGSSERSTWALDITTDVDIPCVAAVSFDLEGRSFCCGLAARPDPAEATCAAIEELCQMEVGLMIAQSKQYVSPAETKLNPADIAHLARATKIDLKRCSLLHPKGVSASSKRSDPRLSFAQIKDRFRLAETDAVLIDLTRPDHAVPVVHALSPGLLPLPNHLPSDHSRRMHQRFGSGELWTHGVSLV